MGIREALKGFAQGLRTTVPDARNVTAMPGTGQIEVVDTSKPPTRYNVPGNWSRALLGPGQPFSTDTKQTARDKDIELEPRSFQYISSVNSTMSPRLAYGLIAFSELRAYAESVPEVSMCLRLLTEEMKAFVPTIVDDKETEIKNSKYQWMIERPDGFNPFPVWLSKFLYNTLIYDAGCSYLVRNSNKKIVGSRVIDGSTIFVVIDERGEQPRPPAPAFQQIIWGVPRLFMNTRQLWYKPRHLRADAPYGRSPIEDSLPAVKLLQSLWDYEYQKYQVGNIPEMVFTVPENWKDNVDAILEFELAFNARMAGNSEERVRARFLPAGMSALNTKELDFNRESYESATNAVRMSFGILQSEVGEGPDNGLGGKGYAEAMQSAFYRMGLAPLLSYVESHFNDIIKMNGDDGFNFKMEFPAESLDPSKEEEKFATRFQIGGIKRDEYRQGIGMPKLGGEEGEFIVQPGGGGGGEGEDPFGMGAGSKPGMLNVGNKNNVQVRRPLKVLKEPLSVLKHPIPVEKLEGSETRVTPEQAKEVGDRLGVDWDTIDLQEFTEGLGEEHEHADTVEGDLDTMARIALDHLKEDPQYYTKLKETFNKFDYAVLQKMVGVDPEDDMLFGTEITNLQDVKMPKQGANTSMIVSIGGGDMDARPAVWKPVSGEKPDLQDYVGGELFRRSEAVYLLDRELASDGKRYLVPLSYMTQNGDEEGSVQHYISHRKPRKTVTSYEPEWIERAAVLDFISGQLDRKQKNYLTHPYNEKRPILIDNELSFSPDPDKRVKSSFVEAMRGEPLSDTTLDMIYLALGNHDLWEDLLACLDDEDAVENARNRAQQLLDEGMLPKPDKTSRLVPVLRATPDNATEQGEEPVLVKADFVESEHPRASDGKFTDKGGGGGSTSSSRTSSSPHTASTPATSSKQGMFQGQDTNVPGVRTQEFRQKAADLYQWHIDRFKWEKDEEEKKNGNWTKKYRVMSDGMNAAFELKYGFMNGMKQPDQDYFMDKLRRAEACIGKNEQEVRDIVNNFPVRRKGGQRVETASRQKAVQNPVRHTAYFNTPHRQKLAQDFAGELYHWSKEMGEGVTHVEFYGDILDSSTNNNDSRLNAIIHVSGRLTRAQHEHNVNIGTNTGAPGVEYEFVSDISPEGYKKIVSIRRDARANKNKLTSIIPVAFDAAGHAYAPPEEPTAWQAKQQAKKAAKQPAPQPAGGGGGAPAKAANANSIDGMKFATSRKVTSPERQKKLEKFATEKVIGQSQINVGNVNETYKVTFPDGSHAILKPFDHNEYGQYGCPITENFCSDLAEELGMGVVPITGYRNDPNYGLCSVMDYAEGATMAYRATANMDNDLARDTASQMVAITTLTGNADRHGKNWLVNDTTGEIYAIDNGFACAIETIGYDPFGDAGPYQRARRGYKQRTSAQKDWIGAVHIPGWRIKPEHLKACEDFMADSAKVDVMLRKHFATDDFVKVVKEFKKHNRVKTSDPSYPYKGKTDDEIKEIAVERAKKQLEAGLKYLQEAYRDQQNW